MSCASTTLYKDGQPIARFQGDYKKLEYTGNGVELKVESINHSKTNQVTQQGVGMAAGTAVSAVYGLK